MKTNDIERSLHRAVSEAPLVDFSALAEAALANSPTLDIRENRQPMRTSFFTKRLIFAASLCFALLLSITAWAIYDRLPAGTVSLDVNPSIVIVVNHRDRVLSVSAVNDDAQAILADLEFPSRDLDETVDTILTALIENGYLTTDTDVVLVSVGSKDSRKADKLAASVEERIRGYNSLEHASLTVLCQIVSLDEDAAEIAAQNGVSVGKMKLITKMIEADLSLQAEDLVEMSVKDLMILVREKQIDLGGTIQSDDDEVGEAANPDSSGTDADRHGNSQAAQTGNQSNNGKTDEAKDNASQNNGKTDEAKGNASQNNGKTDEAKGNASQNNGKTDEAKGNASQNNGKSDEAKDNASQNNGKSSEAKENASQNKGKPDEAKDNASDKKGSVEKTDHESFTISWANTATVFFL